MQDPHPTKVGLALSGGGFRAAFFHVGVLARLAEVGLLRQVQVLSTVSGGSIVGALYYVHLNRRLARNGALEGSDYCSLVQAVETQLLKGAQRNLRARVFANLFQNFHMALPRYSRSDRIGDLYDRYLYRPAWDSGQRSKRIELRELASPPGPDLLINATTLNTGHNWRFETVGMGEPLPDEPIAVDVMEEIDTNMRLGQALFSSPEIPERLRAFPLGRAVAASACVPGVFHPLAITGLYEGIQVQLVDGGVQDNQGVQALFDRGCTHLIVSDASKQLEDDNHTTTRLPGVVGRSLSISSDRIREEQLAHAYARRGTAVAVMHLRKGLGSRRVPPRSSPEQAHPVTAGVTPADYGVHVEVQRALARMRTDLDYVSEYEAYSLGLSAYRMTDHELRSLPALAELVPSPFPPQPSTEWRFSRVAALISARPSGSYRRHLDAAGGRFLRAFHMLPELPAVVFVALVLGALGLAVFTIHRFLGDDIASVLDQELSVEGLLWAGAAAVAIVVLYAGSIRSPVLRRPIDVIFGAGIPLTIAVPAFIWSWLQLASKWLMLKLGRAPRMVGENAGPKDRQDLRVVET